MRGKVTISALILLFFLLLVAVPASFPVGVSYTVSDSMEPTIGSEDGFIRVPAGDVEPGDIVVFEAANREQQYTIHRVVQETPQGYVTKGDNNEVTDQAAGYPYIQREEIHGAVLSIGGTPVTIPNIGSVLQGIQTYQTVLLALLASVLILDTVTQKTHPGRPMRAGEALGILAIVAVVGLVFTILLGGATTGFSFVAVEGEAAAPQTVPVGESVNRTVQVADISRTPFTHYAVDTSQLMLTEQQWNNSTFVLTTQIPPQQTTGIHETTITVNAYPISLPPALINWLHAVHPVLAAALTSIAAIGPWYLVGWFFVDTNARLRGGKQFHRFRRELKRWL